MRTKEQIADYHKIYEKKNHDRLRVYRKLWARNVRLKAQGLPYETIYFKDIPKDIVYISKRKGLIKVKRLPDLKCPNCNILIGSKFVGSCESCLARTL